MPLSLADPATPPPATIAKRSATVPHPIHTMPIQIILPTRHTVTELPTIATTLATTPREAKLYYMALKADSMKSRLPYSAMLNVHPNPTTPIIGDDWLI